MANFYNNYNIDYRTPDPSSQSAASNRPACDPCKAKGATLDGMNPCCEDYMRKPNKNGPAPGCPTGFKPCTMMLSPPPGCDPAGVWQATIMPCPPKVKTNVSQVYKPGPCTRPFCKHWQPKDSSPCIYDLPCKAACFDHPPGIKPGRNPYGKADAFVVEE